jgi:hypothetical protein
MGGGPKGELDSLFDWSQASDEGEGESSLSRLG